MDKVIRFWEQGGLGEAVWAVLLVWHLGMGVLEPAMAYQNASAPPVSKQTAYEESDLEVRLRSQAVIHGPIVRMGDLADFFPAQSVLAARLVQTELFPAPAPGSRRYVSSMEIEELLVRRGLPMAEIRLTGASQVEIRRPSRPSVSEASDSGSDRNKGVIGSRPTPANRRRVEAMVEEAIHAYVQQKAPNRNGWQIKLTSKEELKTIFPETVHGLEVRGGSPPWTGLQWFELSLTGPEGLRSLVVQAEVSEAASVVVAARPIPKGTILQAEDLALQSVPANEKIDGYFSALQEVVGKEALRGLPAGRAIPQDAVQSPLLVRRGQIVTVYARAPGIRVRTQARAKDDGSLSDLVAVESLADRKTFFARVCGPQEVEVFARGIHADTQLPILSESASSGYHRSSSERP
ncbi:MAG: flagellar basal body P-ring formation chaperone FlgA [Thermoguttaceae bacterium]|nr:flagellar basal body P-ring formation chaperone FlgA [Thermoguttaceae bacterium]MDW8038920.1 flagellar basal body P-ring formation chaperone FlgA [Thermoguttaceae bacterium]